MLTEEQQKQYYELRILNINSDTIADYIGIKRGLLLEMLEQGRNDYFADKDTPEAKLYGLDLKAVAECEIKTIKQYKGHLDTDKASYKAYIWYLESINPAKYKNVGKEATQEDVVERQMRKLTNQLLANLDQDDGGEITDND